MPPLQLLFRLSSSWALPGHRVLWAWPPCTYIKWVGCVESRGASFLGDKQIWGQWGACLGPGCHREMWDKGQWCPCSSTHSGATTPGAVGGSSPPPGENRAAFQQLPRQRECRWNTARLVLPRPGAPAPEWPWPFPAQRTVCDPFLGSFTGCFSSWALQLQRLGMSSGVSEKDQTKWEVRVGSWLYPGKNVAQL